MSEVELYFKIKEYTEIEEFNAIINDFLIDIIDDIGGSKTRSASIMNLIYQRPGGRRRTDSLGFDWYESFGYNFDSEGKRHINSIINKLEHAKSVAIITEYSINIDKNLSFDKFISSIKSLENVCNNYDIRLFISFSYPITTNIEAFLGNLKNELSDYSTDSSFDYNKRWVSFIESKTLRLKFTKRVDETLFKSDYNIESELPKNIIDDFKKFTDKLRMTTNDKKQLINIFKKADWESFKGS